MKPTTILAQYKAMMIASHRNCAAYYCDDGKYYLIDDLNEITGVSRVRISGRLREQGFGSDKLLKKDYSNRKKHEQVMLTKIKPRTNLSKEWDRRKCKVHSVPCARYKECCDMRCGLIKGLWIEPDDVSLCYTPQRDRRYGLYPSALSGVSTFGVLGA